MGRDAMTQDLKPGAEPMSWDDVFKSQAIDREGARLRLFDRDPKVDRERARKRLSDRDRKVLVKGREKREDHLPRRAGRWRCWQWWVKYQSARHDITSGWALTEWGATRKAHRRYMNLLNPKPRRWYLRLLNRKDVREP